MLELAESAELSKQEVLERQVRRMLADPRASALVENFAAQWLRLRDLSNLVPDPVAFPDFDENLRQALRQETELFLESQIREDRNVSDLLSANYTFVNERLAQHYGIPDVYGAHFRRVTLDDAQAMRRGGILGHASLLTVTSYPNRTSPVLRGKWVLANVLGTPPPPPPPDVPDLPAKGEGGRVATVRDRLAQHRQNPTCGVCHAPMDPMGLALENYDAVGSWRTSEGDLPIDASGMLPDGTRFSGPAGLRTLLMERREQFVADGHRKTAVVCAWPERRTPGPRRRPSDHAGRRQERLPLVFHHPRDRREHTISHAEVSIMIITKKAIPRRTILRGLGASLALPLLDAMVPAFAAPRNAAGSAVPRLGVVYVPNGMMMNDWLPETEGSGFVFKPIMKPLEPFRDRLLVLSNLQGVESEGPHARASTRFLTGVPSKRADGADLHAGVSMDQLVARVQGRQTQLASLELAIDGRDFAGSCDDGFSCAFTNTIVWSGESTPLPMENNPRAVFERLFGDTGSTDPAVRRARLLRDASLLDSVTERVADLQRGLGPNDRSKLESIYGRGPGRRAAHSEGRGTERA